MGQNLAFSKLRLSSLRESISDDSNKAATDEIIDLLDQTIQFSRSLTYELGSPVLYTVGLEAGIRWLAEQIEKHQGIPVTIDILGNLTAIKNEMKMLLYKTVRELLFNVLKHAQASRVDIVIRQTADAFRIDVMDNGSGFNPDAQTGYGLFSVTERIKYLGGSMKIKSGAEAGTCISISVPLSPVK
jgi:signal transduction histidine kinase